MFQCESDLSNNGNCIEIYENRHIIFDKLWHLDKATRTIMTKNQI